MLKNISSALSPDLLWCLASMGHGERLVLVDRNFPAHDVARKTSTGKLMRRTVNVGHFNAKMSGNTRRMRQSDHVMSKANLKDVESMMPYLGHN